MDAVNPTLPMSNEQMNALDALKAQAHAWQKSEHTGTPQLVLGYWGISMAVPAPKMMSLKIFCYPVGAPLLSSDWQAVSKIARYLGVPIPYEPKTWTSGDSAYLEWEWKES
jgi:hypothetical protein